MNTIVEHPVFVVLWLVFLVGLCVLVATKFKPEILIQTYVVPCKVIDKYKTRIEASNEEVCVVVVAYQGNYYKVEAKEEIYNKVEFGERKKCRFQVYLVDPNKYHAEFV